MDEYLSLGEWQAANQVGKLSFCDEFGITGSAALLYVFVTQKMAIARSAAQEFAGTCLFEAFCDGFACFSHEK